MSTPERSLTRTGDRLLSIVDLVRHDLQQVCEAGSTGTRPVQSQGELAVGIRTFFSTTDPDKGRLLRFGTGAGITFSSDPEGSGRSAS